MKSQKANYKDKNLKTVKLIDLMPNWWGWKRYDALKNKGNNND